MHIFPNPVTNTDVKLLQQDLEYLNAILDLKTPASIFCKTKKYVCGMLVLFSDLLHLFITVYNPPIQLIKFYVCAKTLLLCMQLNSAFYDLFSYLNKFTYLNTFKIELAHVQELRYLNSYCIQILKHTHSSYIDTQARKYIPTINGERFTFMVFPVFELTMKVFP